VKRAESELAALKSALDSSVSNERRLRATLDEQNAVLEQLRRHASGHDAAIVALGNRTSALETGKDAILTELLNLTRLVERIAEGR
jgi:chromosome segregation ATPase